LSKSRADEFLGTARHQPRGSKGQTLGIVGRNGSGKSTPTNVRNLNANCGEVRVNGRVSALLELGSGFNPVYRAAKCVLMGGCWG